MVSQDYRGIHIDLTDLPRPVMEFDFGLKVEA